MGNDFIVDKIAACLGDEICRAHSAQVQSAVQPKIEVAPKPVIDVRLESLVGKIQMCIDFQSLYSLEENFNNCGLSFQPTSRNRMVLCKIKDGRPIAEKVVDDYIFVGSFDDLTTEISENALNKICEFVRLNIGPPSKVENKARSWQSGLRMYEAKLVITNEGMQEIMGDL